MKFKNKYIYTANRSTEIFAWLEYASSESIFEFLKNNRKSSRDLFESYSEEEKYLLTKNDPMINVGLSLYADDEDVLQYLYINGDERIRKFILEGSITDKLWFGYWFDGEIEKIIKNEDLDAISIFLKNSYTLDEEITSFITKNNLFYNLNMDLWLALLVRLTRSSRFSKYNTKYESERFDHYNMFKAAWSLFESIDVLPLSELNRKCAISSLWSIGLNIRRTMLSDIQGYNNLKPDFNKKLMVEKWIKIKAKIPDEHNELTDIIEVLEWIKDNENQDVFLDSFNLQNPEKPDDIKDVNIKKIILEQDNTKDKVDEIALCLNKLEVITGAERNVSYQNFNKLNSLLRMLVFINIFLIFLFFLR